MGYERSLTSANHHNRKLKVSEQNIYWGFDILKQRGYSIRSKKHADGWAYHALTEFTLVSNGKRSSRK
jgi:hypothetical protein